MVSQRYLSFTANLEFYLSDMQIIAQKIFRGDDSEKGLSV